MNPVEEFPLLNLFDRLRQEGLRLGIADYFLFLRALQAGLGVEDQSALERLCWMLWVKSNEDAAVFARVFKELGPQTNINDPNPPIVGDPPLLWKPPENPPDAQVESILLTPQFDPDLDYDLVLQRFKPESAQDKKQSMRSFKHSDEYFEITRRQMKQNWQALQRRRRAGDEEELDVPATVNEIARHGRFIKPVYAPANVKCLQLILLLDRNGSMVPFHELGQRLVETVRATSRDTQIWLTHFENIPDRDLCFRSEQGQTQPLARVLMHNHHTRSNVIIFSDAGAARGRWNDRRIELTNDFFQTVKPQIHQIVWLNPVPRERWSGTTAGVIAEQIPMYEINPRGMELAMNHLCR